MPRFSTHTITPPEQWCHTLANTRLARGLSAGQVSRLLKLPLRYVTALESCDWKSLPGGDYGRYFIKQYAGLLELPAESLLCQYNTEPNLKSAVTSPQKIKLNLSRLINRRWLLIGVVAISAVVYLSLTGVKIFLPPVLTITTPSIDQTVNTPTIKILGSTLVGAQLTINNEAVSVADNGRFDQIVPLHLGLNTINIVAQKTYSRAVTVTRQVWFAPLVGVTTVP